MNDKIIGTPTSDYYARKHARRYPVAAGVFVYGPAIGLALWGLIALVRWVLS